VIKLTKAATSLSPRADIWCRTDFDFSGNETDPCSGPTLHQLSEIVTHISKPFVGRATMRGWRGFLKDETWRFLLKLLVWNAMHETEQAANTGIQTLILFSTIFLGFDSGFKLADLYITDIN